MKRFGSLLFILFLIAGGCAHAPASSSTAVPSESKCEVPSVYESADSAADQDCPGFCWEGIVPGITTRSEAVRILQNSRWIEPGSLVINNPDNNGGATWQWCGFHEGTSSITWRDTVEFISLTLNQWLEVGDFRAVYGDPEALRVWDGGFPESPSWSAAFYYPGQGLVLYTAIDPLNPYLAPTTQVIRVEYFSPGIMESYARSLYRGQPNSSSSIDSFLQSVKPWTGNWVINLDAPER